MNYRHAFHAGNFADVFKHTILLGLLDALKAKPAAFCYVDTHAGRGLYDLRGSEALRTGEADGGVRRVLAAAALPAALRRYADAVRAFAVDDADPSRRHPGSPLLAAAELRDRDRAILCELHPDEAAALKSALRDDTRCAIHVRDGYAALKALLPPAQKRGLVLVDPPFEAQEHEFTAIEAALRDAFARWPQAIYAVWYPIKLRAPLRRFQRALRVAAPPSADVLVAELMLHADDSPLRLNGCGVALVNPPWRFDAWLEAWLPAAAELLAKNEHATWRVESPRPARAAVRRKD
ncbi:MAG TPA: 23S rRNA (adenine(2030)-N(6))-methyltransferase RlmJ [Dokdonella sp.]